MTSEEAVEFGIVDKIVDKRTSIDGKDGEKAPSSTR